MLTKFDYAMLAVICFVLFLAFPALLRKEANYNEYRRIVAPFRK